MKLDREIKEQILKAQRNEITEHIVYDKLANVTKDLHNSKILRHISRDEKEHHDIWKKYSGEEVDSSTFNVWKYYLIARLFGLTFGIKLMERGEQGAQINYAQIAKKVPVAKKIEQEENSHEKQLIGMIDEERLRYIGSIVLGLNDALVELTGALAGFALAFQNTSLVAVMGLITGIAASLSMGASEYLSAKSEGGEKDPAKSALYTGGAYVITVSFLIAPFLLLSNIFMALGITLLNAVIVIFIFTFYISVAKDLDFKRRFAEMVLISMGVAALTFVIGLLINIYFGISV